MAEVDLVEVQLEDSILRVPTLEGQREHGLLELALEALVRGQEEHFGELLGDGAAALDDAPASKILIDGASDAGGVDAVMRIEAGVLRGDDGVAEPLRDLLERDEDPALDVELGDLLIVVIEHLAAFDRIDAFESSHGGEGARQDGERPEGRCTRRDHAQHDDGGEGDCEPAEDRPSRLAWWTFALTASHRCYYTE